MTVVDDLVLDARVQHVGVSPAGRAVMARTELDEEKLGRLVRSFPPAERRSFWIGVLLRDGAITVQQALKARTAPPPRPARKADPPPVMVARSCRRCGATFEERRRRGRPRTLCDDCRKGAR